MLGDTNEKKIRTVLVGLKGEESITETCRREEEDLTRSSLLPEAPRGKETEFAPLVRRRTANRINRGRPAAPSD